MKLFDSDTSITDHRIISAVREAGSVTADGIRSALFGGDSRASAPAANGPTDGPAAVDGTIRSPVVEFGVDNDYEAHKAVVQFWTPEEGGAILGAWEINGQEGDGAVLYRDENKLVLGEKPYWTPLGDQRSVIDLSDSVSDSLWEAFTSLMAHHRRKNSTVRSADVGAEAFDEPPAPAADAVAEPVTATLTNGSSEIDARFQPWRAESDEAVYLGWEIGEQQGQYGILHAAGIWIGKHEQFVGPNGVVIPFLQIEDEQLRSELEARIEDIKHQTTEDKQFSTDRDVEMHYAAHPDSPGQSNPWNAGEEPKDTEEPVS